MNTTTIRLAKQQDVFDEKKFKYYLLIENGDKRKVINVGESTYTDIEKVINEKKDEYER